MWMGFVPPIVDVSAFVPQMWVSAIEPIVFLQVLGNSLYRGGSAEIYNLYRCFMVLQEDP